MQATGSLTSSSHRRAVARLLAEAKPAKLEAAALRWHGLLELESAAMTLAESQLACQALSALASLCAGERSAIDLLRKLLERASPTTVRPIR
jgi:hypothetical protein